MSRTLLRRGAAGLGALLTAAALPLAVATPAQATAGQCAQYLQDRGYTIGAKVTEACAQGAEGGRTNWLDCLVRLKAIEVENAHAGEACTRADW